MEILLQRLLKHESFNPQPFFAAKNTVICIYLDHYAALVVTNGNVVRASHLADKPHPLETVIESRLQAVGVCVPNTDRS